MERRACPSRTSVFIIDVIPHSRNGLIFTIKTIKKYVLKITLFGNIFFSPFKKNNNSVMWLVETETTSPIHTVFKPSLRLSALVQFL